LYTNKQRTDSPKCPFVTVRISVLKLYGIEAYGHGAMVKGKFIPVVEP
jgi:hypothetical protein